MKSSSHTRTLCCLAAAAPFAPRLVLGLCFALQGKKYRFPTAEMAGRGTFDNMLMGVFFALASGMVVGVSVTGGGVNALVGVAISASLLPPIVNSGMMITFGLLGPVRQ